jgi:phenylacetate-CoA ligase
MSQLYTDMYSLYQQAKAAMKNRQDYEYFQTFSREQWLPPEQLELVRLGRLKALLLHALKDSPFHRRRLTPLRQHIVRMTSLAELAALPLLTRADLQNHAEDIRSESAADATPDASGGSTGNPVNFYHSRDYREFGAGLHLLFLSWLDVRPGDPTAVFWGADRDFAERSKREKLMARLARARALNSFDVDDAAMDQFLDELVAFQPRYIYGYASSLHQAASRILTDPHRWPIRPVAIRSSAEMLFAQQREAIQTAFAAPVFNFYGSREINNLAAECPHHRGLHVMASGRIVEITDDKGTPLPAGETGHIVVTDLSEPAFPFIRYLIGDMGRLSTESCPCGRSYPLLDGIVGRSSDILTIAGKQIHGEFFTHLFYGHPEVKQFQVVQETADRLVVKIVSEHADPDTAFVTDGIRKKTGDGVTIEIQRVDRIETTSSGKYRFTVNRMTQNGKERL